MSLESACRACGRVYGEKTGGARVNGIGCTGACLSWGLEFFENIMADCGSGYTEVDLVLFPDAVCEAVNLIFSELNANGWALLNRGMNVRQLVAQRFNCRIFSRFSCAKNHFGMMVRIRIS